VTTGLEPIDDAVGGLMNSDLIVIAGRPGMGKTALAMNIGSNIAMRGESVIVVSIESPALKIFARLVSSAGQIDNRKLQTYRLTDLESDQAVATARVIGQAPIYFLERERRWEKITNTIRSIKLKDENVSLVVIDYVQLVRTSYRVERYQGLGMICGDCKALALELNVPILVLSQLNRKVEERHDKRPNISDLKESGALAQDADVVGLIFRERYYNKSADNTVVLDIAKARDGRTGGIKLHYDEEHVRSF
jgi:replicative DNA helicase